MDRKSSKITSDGSIASDASPWHDETLIPEHESILQCLGSDQSRIFDLEKTGNGYRIVEACDGYFGTTLSQKQLEKLIDELRQLASA